MSLQCWDGCYHYIMDRYQSATDVARALNVNLPRLHRHVRGRNDVRADGHRLVLGQSAVAALRERLGVVLPVEGLTRAQVQALVALSRHPRGLVSVRQVAKAARLSPTAASRALAKLLSLGLVTRTTEKLFDGEVVEREVLEVDWRSERWRETAPLLARAELPQRPSSRLPKRLPPRLANVFWTGDWRRLDVPTSAEHVARRILVEGRHNPEAVAYLGELPAGAVERALAQL